MTQINLQNASEIARLTKELGRPFDPGELRFKPGQVKGTRALALAYLTARAVMDRLDEALGINGWRDEYTLLPTGEVECRLSLLLAGAWVTKADVGGQSEQPDEGDRMKAAYSDALKRAAVKFGIGRYLYRSTNAWHDFDPQKRQFAYPLALTPDGKIVRREEPRPAPKPAQGIPDDPKRVGAWLNKFDRCVDMAQWKGICDALNIAAEAKQISDSDLQKLRAAAAATRTRLAREAVPA